MRLAHLFIRAIYSRGARRFYVMGAFHVNNITPGGIIRQPPLVFGRFHAVGVINVVISLGRLYMMNATILGQWVVFDIIMAMCRV